MAVLDGHHAAAAPELYEAVIELARRLLDAVNYQDPTDQLERAATPHFTEPRAASAAHAR